MVTFGSNPEDMAITASSNPTAAFTLTSVKVEVTQASIREGRFEVAVSRINRFARLSISLKKDSGTAVELGAVNNFLGGIVAWNLDEVIEKLSGSDKETFSSAIATLVIDAKTTIKSKPLALDVAVMVLANWKITNYYTPDYGAEWIGTLRQRGMYAAYTYPSGLYLQNIFGAFEDAVDVEGLGLWNGEVMRLVKQDPVEGFPIVKTHDGILAYFEYPAADQDQTKCDSTTQLRSTSVAVRLPKSRSNDGKLGCDDEVYVPGFKIRTVDDQGGAVTARQIDVWIGIGGIDLKNTADAYGDPSHTALKLLK